MILGCPKTLRDQRRYAVRLARAIRAQDAAEELLTAAKAETQAAFGPWAAGRRTNLGEARAMLEAGGLLEPKKYGDRS